MNDPDDLEYEVSRADKDLARNLYRAAVQAHTGMDENIEDVHADFDDAVARAYKNGDIMVRTERLLQAHLWQMVNAESGRATARMVKDLVSGKTPLPLDDWLDVVVTCGKFRRTTIREITPRDWDRIIEVREENSKKAELALAETKAAAGIALGVLSSCGTMQAAAAAGAIPVRFAS